MSELDERIDATGLSPCAAKTRLADLEAVKAEIAQLADRLGAAILGLSASLRDLRATLDALSARVDALEAQPRIVTAGSQDDDRASPAPPAPLVERVAKAIRAAPTGDDFDVDSVKWWAPVARAALLVAAEDLLRPVTETEWTAVEHDPEPSYRGAFNACILRARLTAAREACR